jgi:hypothetical protein
MSSLFLRITPLLVAAVALAACNGNGGAGSIFGGGGNPGAPYVAQCDPGTQVQLANPLNQQTNVSTNIGSITIVANGNSNVLYTMPSQWSLLLTDGVGDSISTGSLSPVADPNGPHPWGSDFYYSGSLQQQLIAGDTWTVSLLQTNASCTAQPVGTFST